MNSKISKIIYKLPLGDNEITSYKGSQKIKSPTFWKRCVYYKNINGEKTEVTKDGKEIKHTGFGWCPFGD